MNTRRLLLARVAATTAVFGLARLEPAWAAPETAYTDSAFAAAQDAGKAIVVHVAASWCPTCAAQKPILDSLAASQAFADMVRFRVDFDAQKAAVRRFGATMQSTLVVFRGKTEAGRSVGQTDPAALKALLETAKA